MTPAIATVQPAQDQLLVELPCHFVGVISGDRANEINGPAMAESHSSRGMAVADLDNDGDVDVVVWNRNEAPSVLRNDLKSAHHWL